MWQPIVTAPMDGTVIDIWCPQYSGRRLCNVSWRKHNLTIADVSKGIDRPETWTRDSPNGPQPTPTHWMPLPEPPTTAPTKDVQSGA